MDDNEAGDGEGTDDQVSDDGDYDDYGYDDYDDDYEYGRPWARIAAMGLATLAAIALAWFVVRPALSDDESPALDLAGQPSVAASTTDVATTEPADDETTDEASDEPSGEDSSDDVALATTTPPTSDVSADETDEPEIVTATTDDDASDDTSDDEASSDDDGEPAPSTSAAPTTTPSVTTEPTATAPPSTTQATTTQPASSAPSYPTLPDGSPVPVVAIFDVDTVTLSGTVPSEAAARRLETLAIANSKFPNVAVARFLEINPDVPASVGVRVIELNSVRFPESSAEIRLEHAAELNRVVTIMDALPNVSVLVIGHADQRGDAAGNFAISEQRAQAVVSYLASQGVDPARMSSRAVGEADLLSLNNDDAALALNRRTEFVFSGLLVAPE